MASVEDVVVEIPKLWSEVGTVQCTIHPTHLKNGSGQRTENKSAVLISLIYILFDVIIAKEFHVVDLLLLRYVSPVIESNQS